MTGKELTDDLRKAVEYALVRANQKPDECEVTSVVATGVDDTTLVMVKLPDGRRIRVTV